MDPIDIVTVSSYVDPLTASISFLELNYHSFIQRKHMAHSKVLDEEAINIDNNRNADHKLTLITRRKSRNWKNVGSEKSTVKDLISM